MKNKYLGLSVIVLGMTFTSCDDFLDKLPDNRMELSSVENVKDLLVSAYANVNPAYLAEMYSDNADLCQNSGWTEASRFQRQAFEWDDITETGDSESPQELWNGYYSAIASANAALSILTNCRQSSRQTMLHISVRLCFAVHITCLCFPPCSAMHTILPQPKKISDCLILSAQNLWLGRNMSVAH